MDEDKKINATPGKLLPLLPCCGVLDNSRSVTVGCLLKDAYPSKKIEIEPENMYKNISITVSSHNASLHAIFMSIAVSDWERNRITCTSPNNMSVILTNSYCKHTYEGKSDIEVLLPSCGIKPEDNVVRVVCLVSNLKGHDKPFQWLKNGSPFKTDERFKPLKGDGGFFFGSELNISKDSWNKEDEYTCQVEYKTENYIKNISKCLACQESFATPIVKVELPSREDFLNDNATITCSILGTNSDASQVYLMLDGKNSKKKVTTVHSGDNQRVKHSYKVTDKEWEVIKEIICGVKQPCSMPDIHEKINKPLEDIKPKSPSINILASCCDGNEAGMVTLMCIISNFWPQNILVKWLQNGSLYKEDTASVHPMLDRNGNYFATSTLNVSRESWYKEEPYTCEVTHQKITLQANTSICKACQSIFVTPIVEVELPSREDFLNDNATITCSILSTKPDANQVYLMFDGKKSKKNRITVRNGNNQRVKHSYKVTDKEWEPIKEISCVVKQPCSMSDIHVKRNKTLEDIKPKSPIINILASSCDGNEAGMVTLMCTISNFWPQNILVNWLQNGSLYKEDTASVHPMLDRHGNYFATSTLKVPRESWYKEESYTCEVTHQKKTFQANISTGICKEHFSLPDGYIQKPSFKDLFLLKSANVSCKTNLPYADIHWILNGKEKLSEYNNEKKKPGKLSWIESTLEISLEEWKTVSNLSCKLHPPNNVLQEIMTITRSNDPRVIKAPRVYALVTNAENGTEEDQLSLICLVKAFYPEDIFVTWNVNDTIIKEDFPNSEDVTCDHKNQQCSFVSHLSISNEDWVAGKIYMCQVAHISSEFYYIKNISNSNGETTHPKKPLSSDNSSVYHDDGGEDLSDSEEITNIWTTSSTFIALFLLTIIYSGCVTFVKVK
ncbi:uncharacterized protein LOC143960247 [Lithobates pipiens]